MKSSALPSFETPVRETSRTESMIFGAGSLEHMVSGDFDSQSPLYFNIHRERLCAAEHCIRRYRVTTNRSDGKENVVGRKKI